MATNFRVKIGKTGLFTFIRSHTTFRKGLQHRHSDFKKFICDDLAALCTNLVNLSPVTPEFKKGKDVQIAVWLRGATARPCGDQ